MSTLNGKLGQGLEVIEETAFRHVKGHSNTAITTLRAIKKLVLVVDCGLEEDKHGDHALGKMNNLAKVVIICRPRVPHISVKMVTILVSLAKYEFEKVTIYIDRTGGLDIMDFVRACLMTKVLENEIVAAVTRLIMPPLDLPLAEGLWASLSIWCGGPVEIILTSYESVASGQHAGDCRDSFNLLKGLSWFPKWIASSSQHPDLIRSSQVVDIYLLDNLFSYDHEIYRLPEGTSIMEKAKALAKADRKLISESLSLRSRADFLALYPDAFDKETMAIYEHLEGQSEEEEKKMYNGADHTYLLGSWCTYRWVALPSRADRRRSP